MAGFDDALQFTLRWEGGKVDDPTDRGGRTAFGVTQTMYDRWRGCPPAPPRDVFDITPDEIRAFYHDVFWEPLHCETFDRLLGMVLFDSAVQHGNSRAVRWMTAASWAAVENDMVAYALLTLRHEFYLRLVEADPTQGKFIKGWLNRLDALRKEAGL